MVRDDQSKRGLRSSRWRRFLCWLAGEHVPPAGFDLQRRWAICRKCGAMFDAIEQDEHIRDLQTL